MCQQASLFHLAPKIVIIGFTRLLIQVHTRTHWIASSLHASRRSVHLMWFLHYEICYEHCGRTSPHCLSTDQSVASSGTICCPVAVWVIPLAASRPRTARLTREVSFHSPHSCGYDRLITTWVM